MVRLKDLLLEQAVMDLPMAQNLAQLLKQHLVAPWVEASVSTLGGQQRPSVMLRISLDDKRDWPNNILHNSRFSFFHIGHDGVIEQHTYHHKVPKFRKTRFTSPAQVVQKLNTWIDQVK